MSKSTNCAENGATDKLPSFREFLEGSPPGQLKMVDNLAEMTWAGGRWFYELSTPDLYLHCDTEICGGSRMFRFIGGTGPSFKSSKFEAFLRYRCSNCKEAMKLFSVHLDMEMELIKEAHRARIGSFRAKSTNLANCPPLDRPPRPAFSEYLAINLASF